MLKNVEDLRRGLNAGIGRKDFFEMASKHLGIGPSDFVIKSFPQV
jgi:hypothetical protein